MTRCDPLALVEETLGKIRDLVEDAKGVLDGLPNTLEELLQCVTFGYATRSTGVLDPRSLEAFDFDALSDRVKQILSSVSKNQDEILGTYDDAAAATGTWLLADPGNTFYGLAIARTTTGLESAFGVETVIRSAEASLDELRRISDQLQGPEGEELLRRARRLVEEICPELASIGEELSAIGRGVGATRDLGRNLCGATSLQARLAALLASLPTDVAAAVRLFEVATSLKEDMEVLDVLTASMNEVADDITRFDEEIAAGSFLPQTEERVFSSVAEELAKVCEELNALSERRRYAEMVSLEPRIRDLAAIATVALASSPESRVTAIQQHAARDPFRQWKGSLSFRAPPGNAAMNGIFGSLPGAIVDKSDQLLFATMDVENVFEDARRLRDVYITAGGEFLSLAQEFTDQVCTGALKRLLFKYGYDFLEKLYTRGLFGDLPEAIYRASTSVGRAVECLKGLTTGTIGLLTPLTGEQRFAIEAVTDTMRTLENATHLVARISREIDLHGPPPIGAINEIAAIIEREAKGALRGIGISLPPIADSQSTPDGFVRFLGNVRDLPEGIVSEADGFLRAETGAVIPDGYGRSPEGYLIASP